MQRRSLGIMLGVPAVLLGSAFFLGKAAADRTAANYANAAGKRAEKTADAESVPAAVYFLTAEGRTCLETRIPVHLPDGRSCAIRLYDTEPYGSLDGIRAECSDGTQPVRIRSIDELQGKYEKLFSRMDFLELER